MESRSSQSLKIINTYINIIMKKLTFYSIAILTLLSLTSCEAVETIFKAGMWWGIILVVGVIAIILWLFSRGRNS
jgi:hypothetical protein